MNALTSIEIFLRRDRLIVTIGLGTICFMSWIYLLTGAGMDMDIVAGSTFQFPPSDTSPYMNMSRVNVSWDLSSWILMFIMWWVMMIAMMVPSAAPMILLYGRVKRYSRKGKLRKKAVVHTGAFAFGYLLIWLLFSVVVTLLHWGLEMLGLIHSMRMWSINDLLSGLFLIAAGLYQCSAIKHVCLKNCQSPVDFLSRHWRNGRWGALCMGAVHGGYCVGCCWVLMILLFVGGVMNLVWIAGIAILVLLEKLIRSHQWVRYGSAVSMLGAGIYLII